jgi:hypothetical protein
LGLRRGTVFLSKVMVISEGGLDYKAVRISVRRLLLTRASVRTQYSTPLHSFIHTKRIFTCSR